MLKEQPTQRAPTVLVVDDESGMREAVRHCLLEVQADGRDLQILEAGDGREALRVLDDSASAIDLVLLDLRMPGLGGAATLEELRRRGHEVPVLLLTSEYEVKVITPLMRLGVAGYIMKPYDDAQLAGQVTRLLARDQWVPRSDWLADPFAPAAGKPSGSTMPVLLIGAQARLGKHFREALPRHLPLFHRPNLASARTVREHVDISLYLVEDRFGAAHQSALADFVMATPDVAVVTISADRGVALTFAGHGGPTGVVALPVVVNQLDDVGVVALGDTYHVALRDNVLTFGPHLQQAGRLINARRALQKSVNAAADRVVGAGHDRLIVDLNGAAEGATLRDLLLTAGQRCAAKSLACWAVDARDLKRQLAIADDTVQPRWAATVEEARQ